MTRAMARRRRGKATGARAEAPARWPRNARALCDGAGEYREVKSPQEGPERAAKKWVVAGMARAPAGLVTSPGCCAQGGEALSARRSPSRGAARAAATLCRRLAPSTLLCRISYAVRFPVDLQLPGDVLEAAAEPQERGGRLELSGAAAATPNGRPIGTQGAQSKRAIMAGCNIDKARRKVWRHPAWGAPAAGSTRAGGIAEGSSQVVTPSPARRCSLKVNARPARPWGPVAA